MEKSNALLLHSDEVGWAAVRAALQKRDDVGIIGDIQKGRCEVSVKLMLLAVVVVLTVVAPACLRSDETGEESPTATQPSSDAGATTATPSATSVSPTPEWTPTSEETVTAEAITASPLATWDSSQVEYFHQAGIGPGTLEVSDGCVLLIVETGARVLPIWPEPTAWNATSQTIEYVGPGPDERAQLRAGDRVSLGGSTEQGSSLYVRAPAVECRAQAGTTFFVSEVRVESH